VPAAGIVIQDVIGVLGRKTITVTPAPGQSGTATITVTVSDGQTSTDTSFQVTVLPSLEIAVELENEIPSGGTVNFGTIAVGSTQARSFTIRNLGLSQAITLTGDPRVKVTGADFTVTSQPTLGTIASGGTSIFTVQFAPTSAGASSAQLDIKNHDSDEGTYIINLTGIGTSPLPVTITTSTPTIIPASATEQAKFSAAVTGPPGAVVILEASTDLGVADAWEEIHRITLDANGNGAFSEIEDQKSLGAAANFYRLKME
jgi:hypothetical protein